MLKMVNPEDSAVVRSRELLRLGDIDGSSQIAEAEVARVEDHGDTTTLWRARFIRAEILSMRGNTEAALKYLNSLTAPATDEPSVALKLNRGRYLGLLGRLAEARALLAEAESSAREARYLEVLGEIYLSQGFVSYVQKEYESSDREFRLALNVSNEVGGWYLRGHSLWGIGKVLMIKGCYGSAMPWLEESLKIFEVVGARLSLATVWAEVAVCRLGLGEDQDALELLLKAAAIEHSAGFLRNYQVTLADIGNVYLHRRDYFTALSYYRRALSLARQIKDPISVRKWTYNTNLAYARIRAHVDQEHPRPAA